MYFEKRSFDNLNDALNESWCSYAAKIYGEDRIFGEFLQISYEKMGLAQLFAYGKLVISSNNASAGKNLKKYRVSKKKRPTFDLM